VLGIHVMPNIIGPLLILASMDVPVVVTRLKAIGRIVEDGVNGLVCPSEDVEAYAEAFLRLIGDRALAKRLGASGRDLVERDFDWRQIMKKEVAEYTPEVLALSSR